MTENFGKKRVKYLVCALALMIAVMALPGCSSDEEALQAASDQVTFELNTVKEGKTAGISAAEELSDEVSEEMLDVYDEKLRDFDFGIVSAEKTDPEETGGEAESVSVTVRVKTYDFGTVYLETWKDYMSQNEAGRDESQFYSDLFTRIAALDSKDYTKDVVVTCTDLACDGTCQTDIRTNEALMNALSGDMLAQMKELAEE